MIRLSLLGVNSLTVRNLNAYDHLISSGPHIQSVRWKRKPIWLPTAKSKMFRVPVRPIIPTEDQLELKRLHNNYRTLVNSLNNFFVEREKERTLVSDINVEREHFESDFQRCSQLNDIWNKNTAELRSKRLIKEREDRANEIAQKLECKKERDLKIQERVDSEIRKAKEEESTYITPENIDEAILSAVQNVVNHNVAIDVQGNVYKELLEKDTPHQVAH